MELHQLQGFFEVAREGSFTRAADKLYLTQPAISLQLKGLEEELGETLFERRRRNARLTPAGEILFRRAKAVFDELAAARDEIEGPAPGPAGEAGDRHERHQLLVRAAARAAGFPRPLSRGGDRHTQQDVLRGGAHGAR